MEKPRANEVVGRAHPPGYASHVHVMPRWRSRLRVHGNRKQDQNRCWTTPTKREVELSDALMVRANRAQLDAKQLLARDSGKEAP